MDYEDRRLVRVYIGEQVMYEAVMSFLTDSGPPEYRLVCKDPSLPRDVKVVRVVHDWMHQAFGVTLQHPSFDVVPDGDMIPDKTSIFLWSWVKVNKEGTSDTPNLVNES